MVSAIPLQPYPFFFFSFLFISFLIAPCLSHILIHPPIGSLFCALFLVFVVFLWTSTTFHTTQNKWAPHGTTHSPLPSSADPSLSVSNTLVFYLYFDSQPSMQQQMNVPFFFKKVIPLPLEFALCNITLLGPWSMVLHGPFRSGYPCRVLASLSVGVGSQIDQLFCLFFLQHCFLIPLFSFEEKIKIHPCLGKDGQETHILRRWNSIA